MPTRRDLLKLAPAGLLAGAAGRAQDAPPAPAPAPAPARGYPGLTVRVREPQNLESAFSELAGPTTPVEQFYVRSHFPTPAIDPAKYTLTVEGEVQTPLTLTLADLAALPQVAMPLTLECAGNGRVFLTPPARGAQWGLGAVGTADWGGVRLASVLDKAGVKPGAVEVILVGSDGGTVADPATPGAVPFDRSIPLEKARRPEVLLATAMNGGPLTPAHGFPVRAVVGGYYGMAAVKWLKRIVVTAVPYSGYWQSVDYAYFDRTGGGLASLRPVADMQVKAQIARPTLGEVVPAGNTYRVAGAAWAGAAGVAKVELSTDGGKTFAACAFATPARPFCWRVWSYDWTPAAPGPAALVVRATDGAGATQPVARDPDRRTYLINHLVPVDVVVR